MAGRLSSDAAGLFNLPGVENIVPDFLRSSPDEARFAFDLSPVNFVDTSRDDLASGVMVAGPIETPFAANIAPTVVIRPSGGALPVTPQASLGVGVYEGEVLGLRNGNFVVARPRETEPGATVYQTVLSAFDAAGNLLRETILAPGNGGAQPDLKLLTDGSFVASYPGGMERFDETGVRIGAKFPGAGSVAVLSNGQIAVTWATFVAGSSMEVRAQIYSADGTKIGGEIAVNSATVSDQDMPEIAALANGGFVVQWRDASRGIGGAGGDTSGAAVKAQVFSAAGDRVGSEILVNTTVPLDQLYGQLAGLTDGRFVSVWLDPSTGGIYAAKARIFSADGIPLGGEILLGTTGTTLFYPEVAALPNGGFVAAWGGSSVSMQLFAPDGTKVGGAVLVDSNGKFSDIAVLSTGGFVIGWVDPAGPRAQMYDAAGNPFGGQTTLNATSDGSLSVELAPLLDGKFAAIWLAANNKFYTRAFDDVVTYSTATSVPLSLKGTIDVGDVDAGGGVLTVTLAVSTGTVTVTPGSTGVTVAGNGSASVNVTGTLAQLGALLGSGGSGAVDFQTGVGGTTMLTVTINDNGNSGDGGARTASATAQINVETGYGPVIQTSAGTVNFVESADNSVGFVRIDPSIVLTDPDSARFASATVRIVSNFVAGQDVLAVRQLSAGISASYDAATGVLTLTSANAQNTVAQWRDQLRQVEYRNASDAPSTATRTVEIVVNDGLYNSAPARIDVTVQAVNDTPTLDLDAAAPGTGTTAAYGAPGTSVLIAPNGVIADPDSPDFAGGRLVVSYNSSPSSTASLFVRDQGSGAGQIGVAGDVISYQGVAIATKSGGAGGTPLVVTFNGASTLAAANALLHVVGYTNSQGAQQPSLNITFSDGDNGTSAPAVANITATNGFSTPARWLAQANASSNDWYVGDFNGDGKADTFRYAPGISGADMKLSTGTSFNAVGGWTGAGYGVDNKWYVGDFNGDGKSDIFRYLASASGADMFLSTGASFRGAGSWLNVGYYPSPGWFVGDFNGDGKSDIFRYVPGISGADMFLSTGVAFSGAGGWTGAGLGVDNTWHVGDFNGDGKDDIFRYLPGTSGADVFLSTGTSFVRSGSWTGAGVGSDGKWYVADFNGDGKDDLLRYIEGTGTQVLLSTGTAFAAPTTWTPAGTGAGGWQLGDFTGDGRVDLMRVLGDGLDVLQANVVL